MYTHGKGVQLKHFFSYLVSVTKQKKDFFFYHVTNTIKLFVEQTQCLGNVLVQIELFLYR
jgi:hypothetical protein